MSAADPDTPPDRLTRLDTVLSIVQRVAVVAAIVLGGTYFLLRQEGENHVSLKTEASITQSCIVRTVVEVKNLKGRVFHTTGIGVTVGTPSMEPVPKSAISTVLGRQTKSTDLRLRIGEAATLVLSVPLEARPKSDFLIVKTVINVENQKEGRVAEAAVTLPETLQCE